jgi:hypothetical protein
VGVDFLRLRSDTEPDKERKSGDPQESNQSTKQKIYNQPEFALLLLFVCFGGGASDLSAVEGVSFVCAQIRKTYRPSISSMVTMWSYLDSSGADLPVESLLWTIREINCLSFSISHATNVLFANFQNKLHYGDRVVRHGC